MTDIRDGYPRWTQGFSVASPKTSLASGKLPTRRNCLSPVSAISTSKVAALGRDSYTSLWPAQTGHTILISEQSNIYPFWDLQHNPHIHLNTLINPYYSTYKCHKQYNIPNSGNSHYPSISTRIYFNTCSRDKLPVHLVVRPGATVEAANTSRGYPDNRTSDHCGPTRQCIFPPHRNPQV